MKRVKCRLCSMFLVLINPVAELTVNGVVRTGKQYACPHCGANLILIDARVDEFKLTVSGAK